MYYENQTLQHKITGKLAVFDSYGYGYYEKLCHFVDENGRAFRDNLDNYINIEDEFGATAPGECDGKVDMSLKRYVTMSKKEKEKLKFSTYRRAARALFKLLRTTNENDITQPYYILQREIGGFDKYFLKLVNAQPIIVLYGNRWTYKKQKDGSHKKVKLKKQPFVNGPLWFGYQGRMWYVKSQTCFTRIHKFFKFKE